MFLKIFLSGAWAVGPFPTEGARLPAADSSRPDRRCLSLRARPALVSASPRLARGGVSARHRRQPRPSPHLRGAGRRRGHLGRRAVGARVPADVRRRFRVGGAGCCRAASSAARCRGAAHYRRDSLRTDDTLSALVVFRARASAQPSASGRAAAFSSPLGSLPSERAGSPRELQARGLDRDVVAFRLPTGPRPRHLLASRARRGARADRHSTRPRRTISSCASRARALARPFANRLDPRRRWSPSPLVARPRARIWFAPRRAPFRRASFHSMR
jgi:hypothetical protein